MVARIYQPARTAMQAGKAGTRRWVLEYELEAPRQVEPLMGWTSNTDMRQELRQTFPTREAAVAYAERMGLAYRVVEPQAQRAKRLSYADNFRFGRPDQWTH